MVNESKYPNRLQNLQSLIEQDLLDIYLSTEGLVLEESDDSSEAEIERLNTLSKNMTYPWKPAEPIAEEFFNTLEQEFSLDAWQADELAQRSQAFFGRIDQLWNTVPTQVTLSQRFAAYIPQDLLAMIVQKAQQVLSSSASLADQLVQCVQELPLSLAEDDLFTLARPYANAMRGPEPELRANWEELSEPNRARVALAIARAALDELRVSDNG